MRITLLGLLAATALSTTIAAPAFAQSPFGAPSAPLTAEEIHAIKEEGAVLKRQREAAARKAAEKREAAAAAKAEKEAAEAAAMAAPVESMVPPSADAAAASAPAPMDAAPSAETTVIPNAVVDPMAPGGVVAAPAPAPAPMVPAPDMPVAPADPIQVPAADVPPGGFPAPADDSGIPPLPTGE